MHRPINGTGHRCIGIHLCLRKTYKKWWSTKSLTKSTVVLHTHTDQPLDVTSSMEDEIKYKSQQAQIPLLVVVSKGPNLLGRNWLCHIKLD